MLPRRAKRKRPICLIAKGADINAKDEYGWTPLHYAAIKGQKEVVELLIAKGADINSKNQSGETPLHDAIDWNHKEMVELLNRQRRGHKRQEQRWLDTAALRCH